MSLPTVPPADRCVLAARVKAGTTAQRDVLRARIILAAPEHGVRASAHLIGCAISTVVKWRGAATNDPPEPFTTWSHQRLADHLAALRATSSSSRRTRCCAGPRPTSPATSSQNGVSAGRRPGRRRDPRHGDWGYLPLAGERVLGFTKQAYYAWRAAPVTERDWSDAHLINAAIGIHADDPTSGYRFIADELAQRGIAAGENRVARLRRAQRLCSVLARKPGTGRTPGPAVYDDHVKRIFTAEAPNRLWLTDITEHWTGEGKLYLCAVKDVFSGRIVGYSIDSRMKASLAVAALQSAVARRGASTAMVHSDRGTQFRSKAYVRELAAAGLTGSMGRVGACADSAAMESFFALLQKNVLDQKRWRTRQELRLAVITWIERTYHRRRRQRALGKMTPIEYEAVHALTLAA